MNIYEKQEIEQMFHNGEISYFQAIEMLEKYCRYSFYMADNIVSNWDSKNKGEK